MFITGFSYSVTRACIMGTITLLANVFYKKQDSINCIAISMLIMVAFNPFVIYDIGFKLSYLATLGIILLNKNIESLLSKKINKKIAKTLSVIFSAQIALMPIVALEFNNISLVFFISNFLASFLIGPIIILGFVIIFISFISFKLAKLLAIILNLLLVVLNLVAKLVSKIPFSNITIVTPYLISIIIIYLLIFISNYIYTIYISKKILRRIEKNIFKYVNIKKMTKATIIAILIIISFNLFYSIFIPKTLNIYFVDVMQGDCTFIVTPKNKTILIDGGEENNDTLFSYLLDRRVKKVDYIIISHFDSDHVRRAIRSYAKIKSRTSNNSKTKRRFCELSNI